MLTIRQGFQSHRAHQKAEQDSGLRDTATTATWVRTSDGLKEAADLKSEATLPSFFTAWNAQNGVK